MKEAVKVVSQDTFPINFLRLLQSLHHLALSLSLSPLGWEGRGIFPLGNNLTTNEDNPQSCHELVEQQPTTDSSVLTLDDVDGDRVGLGLRGRAGVVAGVGLGHLGDEQPRRPPPALRHHADPAPAAQSRLGESRDRVREGTMHVLTWRGGNQRGRRPCTRGRWRAAAGRPPSGR